MRGLTRREFEIFRLLARGLALREVAEHLGVSAKTVSNHVSLLKQKLQVSTQAELVHRAIDSGVLRLGLPLPLAEEGSRQSRLGAPSLLSGASLPARGAIAQPCMLLPWKLPKRTLLPRRSASSRLASASLTSCRLASRRSAPLRSARDSQVISRSAARSVAWCRRPPLRRANSR